MLCFLAIRDHRYLVYGKLRGPVVKNIRRRQRAHSETRGIRGAAQPPSRRRPGTAKGLVTIADDFQAPLPPDEAEAFYRLDCRLCLGE